MNALKLMIPKSEVRFLFDVSSFAEGIGLLKSSGYSSVPVVSKTGAYVGVVSDKDFLNYYMKANGGDQSFYHRMVIRDVMSDGRGKPINVNSEIDDELLSSMEQNFVSVIDDTGRFLGIITRREIIRFLKEESALGGGFSLQPQGATASQMELALNQIERKASQLEMFFRMYEAGMKEICIRLETINDLLSFKYNREPLQQMENRLKDPKSIMGKLARKNLPPTMDAMRNNLFDIAGVRVICSYVEDVYEFKKYLAGQRDLVIMREKDYIKNPKPNGYRSLHLIVSVPVNFLEATQMIPVEIQFRTKPMDYWASLEHDLRYKPVYNHASVDISGTLLKISEELDHVEQEMQELARLLSKEDSDIFEEES